MTCRTSSTRSRDGSNSASTYLRNGRRTKLESAARVYSSALAALGEEMAQTGSLSAWDLAVKQDSSGLALALALPGGNAAYEILHLDGLPGRGEPFFFSCFRKRRNADDFLARYKGVGPNRVREKKRSQGLEGF